MNDSTPQTILCIASYLKGEAFLREAKRLDARVLLLTDSRLEHADWPWDSLDEFYHMPNLWQHQMDEVIRAVSYLARTERLDHIVALDDFDVETAAALREHLGLPGLSASGASRFRDKLAMRMNADAAGIPVPAFVPTVNYEVIRTFTERVPAPWILKPRSEASSIGMARIDHPDELWPRLEALSDRQSYYLLERFLPGKVYHLDGLVVDRTIRFADVHQYGRPPMEVFHQGGIAMSRPLERGSEDEEALQQLGRQVIAALGLERGATHMEFIKAEDGQFYFLEAAARVGGASTAETVEAATGINLWAEWAKIELVPDPSGYRLPERRNDFAGILMCLARQEQPDTSAYTDPEIVWRLSKEQHVGFIVCSPDATRVNVLLDEYARRFEEDFIAVLPPWEVRPPSHT